MKQIRKYRASICLIKSIARPVTCKPYIQNLQMDKFCKDIMAITILEGSRNSNITLWAKRKRKKPKEYRSGILVFQDEVRHFH